MPDIIININVEGAEGEAVPKVNIKKRKLKNGVESVLKMPDTQTHDAPNAILKGLGL